MSDYQRARRLIRDGDLIAVRGSHLIDHLTSAVTRSPYTHTGVAVWADGRLFMADLNSGRNHLTALSAVADFDVFMAPDGIDRARIRKAVFDWLAAPIDYGMLAFIVIGLKCALGLKVFIHWRRIIVCSGGSVEIYENAARAQADAHQPAPAAWLDHTRMLSPGELAGELRFALAVRAEAAA